MFGASVWRLRVLALSIGCVWNGLILAHTTFAEPATRLWCGPRLFQSQQWHCGGSTRDASPWHTFVHPTRVGPLLTYTTYTVYPRREVSDKVSPCGCNGAFDAASSLNCARGGESERRRDGVLPSMIGWPGLMLGAAMPAKSGALDDVAGCAGADRGRGATTPVSEKSEPTCRKVNGLAVAAACLLYSLYRLYGVAAPGLLS